MSYHISNIKHCGLDRLTSLSSMSFENGKEVVDSGQARLAALGKLPVLQQLCLFLLRRGTDAMVLALICSWPCASSKVTSYSPAP